MEQHLLESILDVFTNLDNLQENSNKTGDICISVSFETAPSNYNIYTDKDYIAWCKQHGFYKFRYDSDIVDLYLRLCGEGLTK